MNLSWHNADKVWFCHAWPILQELLAFDKIQLPRFFSAALWDIELKFGVWIYFGLTTSNLSFVKLDLLLQELLPFAKIYSSRLFHAVFWDFELKQIKFQFICFCRRNASLGAGRHTGIFKGCGYSSRLWLQFLKVVATGKNGRFARESSGKSTTNAHFTEIMLSMPIWYT